VVLFHQNRIQTGSTDVAEPQELAYVLSAAHLFAILECPKIIDDKVADCPYSYTDQIRYHVLNSKQFSQSNQYEVVAQEPGDTRPDMVTPKLCPRRPRLRPVFPGPYQIQPKIREDRQFYGDQTTNKIGDPAVFREQKKRAHVDADSGCADDAKFHYPGVNQAPA